MKVKETKSEKHSLLKVTRVEALRTGPTPSHLNIFHVQCALLPVADTAGLLIRAELLEVPERGKNTHISDIHYSRVMSAKWLSFGFLQKHVLLME